MSLVLLIRKGVMIMDRIKKKKKSENLRDIGMIKRIKEGKPSDYLTADQIDKM